ncbi:MAG TPA: cation diffusion facilitator family transporter [Bacillota bacterium]|nr:cation diffusion facilitator family transporter [Bacillota bacterium]
MADQAREEVGKRVAWISLWGNIILTISKVVIGWQAHSESVFADGIHSAADVFASLIVLLVINVSNKPADKEHPYGHGKAEVIISGIIGGLLFLVSIYIAYEGILSFFEPVQSPMFIALWVALFSYIAKVILFRYSLKVANQYNSKAIEAIAFDHKADIVASLAAAFGVGLSIFGDYMGWFIFRYSDAVASIFVAYLIFKIAKELSSESFHILMERNVDSELLQEYESIISQFSDVKRIDRLRGREHGHYIILDVRVSIDYFKTIKEGHDIGRKLKEAIMAKFDNVQEVLIHLNPYYKDEEK